MNLDIKKRFLVLFGLVVMGIYLNQIISWLENSDNQEPSKTFNLPSTTIPLLEEEIGSTEQDSDTLFNIADTKIQHYNNRLTDIVD